MVIVMRVRLIILNENKEYEFYNHISLLKFIGRFGYEIKVNYKGKEYKDYNPSVPKKIEAVMKCVSIMNTRDKKTKYSLIYDYSCDYLDKEFREKNLCDFKNDICCCNRAKTKSKRVGSCCIKTTTKEVCEHFDKEKKYCKIKSITCKLFVCPYLKNKNINYPVNKIPYLKYFLNFRQKAIIKSNPFVDKDEMIEKLIKFYIIF